MTEVRLLRSVSPRGPRGVGGLAPAHTWSGTSLSFKNPDGTDGPFVNLLGLTGPSGNAQDFAHKATLEASTVSGGVDVVNVLGYDSPGDGGGFQARRVGSEPAHGGKVQAADGQWWEIFGQLLFASSFGATADGTDSTDEMLGLIEYLPPEGCAIWMPRGGLIGISEQLVFNRPVRFLGHNPGNAAYPAQAPASGFIWLGDPTDTDIESDDAPMIVFGHNGAEVSSQFNMWSGSMGQLVINGGGKAAIGLRVKDASQAHFPYLSVRNTPVAGVHLTNTPGFDTPSVFLNFDHLLVDLRADGMNAAHGVVIDGINDGDSGSSTTICRFDNPVITHHDGDAFHFKNCGDGMTIIRPHCYRDDAGSGHGANYQNTGSPQNVTGCLWIQPIMSGGMNFSTPGTYAGMRVDWLDSQNVAAGSGQLHLYGPGANEVYGSNDNERKFGLSRLNGSEDVYQSDNMGLVFFDDTNALVHTTGGNWRTSSLGGACIEAADLDGSGIVLKTAAVLNDISQLARPQTKGVSVALLPVLQFVIGMNDTANVKAHWGLFSDNASDPTDGIFVRYNSAVSPNYFAVTRFGGVEQAIDTTINAVSLPHVRWRIDIEGTAAVNFYAIGLTGDAGANPGLWFHMTRNTVRVPNSSLFYGMQVQALAAAIKRITCADFRLSHLHGWR